MRILVVEDDELTAQALTEILVAQNYAVEVARDGQAASELIEAFAYDLILLDIVLPKLDGITLCRQVRSQGHQMPILLLTGQDKGHDKAIGLDAGADDYLVKPFDAEELSARVRALLRRSGAVAQPILEWGELRLDPSSCEVTYRHKLLTLTPKEYALLELLMRNSRRVFSCGLILEHLWSFGEMPGEEAVRTHIKGLRHKLKLAGAPPDLIETVYGIGYRLKSLEALPAAAQEVDHPIRHKTLTGVSQIWDHYRDRVQQQVAVIERAIVAVGQRNLTTELRRQAVQEAHTLGGSLGTFGFGAASRAARAIEQRLQAEKAPSTTEILQLRHWLKLLQSSLDAPPQALAVEPMTQTMSQPWVLIISCDRPQTEQLIAEAANWEIQVDVAVTLSVARHRIYRDLPTVVLLDLDVADCPEDSFKLLTELSQQSPPVPVIVIATPEHLKIRPSATALQERLEIVRLGGRTFLQKPTHPVQVFAAIQQVLQNLTSPAGSILAVDDDPKVLAMLRSLLEPWGLKVTTLADPQNFWETLEATAPDLLILDIRMPHMSGIELCQIVRNDARWSSLPIMILTAHLDAETVNHVFAVGADDFVSKPIIGPELVTRIINRLERIRLLRNFAEIDPLTKVANRYKSTQDLSDLLRLAKQHQQPLCFALLDLDNFKSINHCYGHATGDWVLQQVAQLLRQSFREDVVARWGGEEFVIGLYGVGKQEGMKRLERVLESLHRQTFATFEGSQNSGNCSRPLYVTFSAGVAEYPGDGDNLHQLYQSADAALLEAKAAGCDQVMCA